MSSALGVANLRAPSSQPTYLFPSFWFYLSQDTPLPSRQNEFRSLELVPAYLHCQTYPTASHAMHSLWYNVTSPSESFLRGLTDITGTKPCSTQVLGPHPMIVFECSLSWNRDLVLPRRPSSRDGSGLPTSTPSLDQHVDILPVFAPSFPPPL
ncbi:hypothetical protein KCV07_g117, partial [Aureobasidium melanogenum]